MYENNAISLASGRAGLPPNIKVMKNTFHINYMIMFFVSYQAKNKVSIQFHSFKYKNYFTKKLKSMN